MSISADGSKAGTGILWANLPFFGDANQEVVNGVLRAFDAADVGKELWNSHDDPDDDFGKLSKNAPPTIANGRVYVSTFAGAVCAYGLRAPKAGQRRMPPARPEVKHLARSRDALKRLP